MIKNKSILNAVISLVVFGALSLSTLALGKEPARIRVAILKDVPEAAISVQGAFEVLDARAGRVLYQGRNWSTSKVVPVSDGIKIKNQVFKTAALTIKPKKSVAITVHNRRYRGEISIFKDGGRLLVVNTLDLESYVKGVLYHEISPKWPLDAIKAQAIATRTYALYQREVMKVKDYDVSADVSSQVYGGHDSEKSRTNRAVNFTHGQVLVYQGKSFPAYFHATCGGMTEDASELWKIDLVPLDGGRACSFCQASPHYYWDVSFDLKAVQKKLGRLYTLQGELANISIAERDASGRVRTLELKDAENKSVFLSAKDIRHSLGPDAIRSTNFAISLDQGRAVFSGKGWGHGVGLCQWGALGMSRQGYDYQEILQFYYPGAEIQEIK